ncbi:MAG: S8 family serine peptidase [Pyrinomonadaceae bacterium]
MGTAESLRSRPVVLEFVQQPEISEAVNRTVEEVRETEAWSNLTAALKKVDLSRVTSGIPTELMEAGRSEPELLPMHAARLLRHLKILCLSDNFFKVVGSITDQIEKASRVVQPEILPKRGPASAITEVCWLNRTVRSFGAPQALAEVAADDSIQYIDVTRPLTPEILVSRSTIGVPNFRGHFNVSGRGVIVAVIDFEVALNHPALKGRVIHRRNYTTDPWGNPNAHGTAVAGIIASNDAQFMGIAPEATIYNYKVLAPSSGEIGDDFDGALALQAAAKDGVHIANCSWGTGPASDGTSRQARACNEAWKLGLTIVKSAGNRGPDSATLTSPADADGIIVVGATEREGTQVQGYSSRGPSGEKRRPHLVAPGGILEGTGITSCLPGGGFGDCGAGTSFAAPHVSGMLALLVERNPSLKPDQLRNILISACDPLVEFDNDAQGRGLVSLFGIN